MPWPCFANAPMPLKFDLVHVLQPKPQLTGMAKIHGHYLIDSNNQ